MPFIIGLIVFAAIVFFAFFNKPNITDREKMTIIARIVIALLLAIGVALLIFVK